MIVLTRYKYPEVNASQMCKKEVNVSDFVMLKLATQRG